ncbi:UNVERIFIED_CONTAM: Retrovirus-related Pol polyprotein from transposon RE1 [Sesamum latifolium]|uniref:Retrovirus-related Pol polyprotein from transposon RE1 n=1 Tax=Sesamum latifolium TaxID=2727402 RepID=A0AAW2UYS9_9LAMI
MLLFLPALEVSANSTRRRDKIGFIDGSCVKPDEGSAEFKQWRITDSMVRTWILNTISKDIVNAYLYANSARSLWLELESRYGECDGPLLYKIQREIGSTKQGNLSVTAYYTQLKQLWDELVCLKPPAMCKCGRCICGSNEAKVEEIEASQLIQFLTGLNESYDSIRSQILVLDPLPHVNKAFSMILRIERQRQNWSSKDTCFKLHGVPDWYKELTDQKKRNGDGGRAYMAHEGNSVDMPITTAAAGTNLVADLMEALRLIQNKVPQDPVRVHFAQADEMAVDDYTRVTWTFLMHHKSQTVSILSSFLAKVATQFDTKVRTLRTDNGTEFLSLPCQNFYINTGQKGYKVFDLDNRVVLVSRDVVFMSLPFPTLLLILALSLTLPITESPSSSEQVPLPDPSPSVPPPRPHRHIKPPTWLKDYCHSTSTYPALASSHDDFMAAFSTILEPNHYLQAKGILEWENAMTEELAALELDRYKARLVARGYNQVEGEDYLESFSPVAKAVSVRLLLVVASSCAWPIHQVDINNAFLHGFLDEDIYMKPPDGAPIPTGKVSGLLVLLVYVDDVLLTGHSKIEIAAVKRFLDSEFTIKDLSPAKYFLGLEIARCDTGTLITQHKYIRDIIHDAGLTDCKPASTPLPIGLKLSAQHSDPLPDPGSYRRLVGRLLYLSFTKPDISFGAQQLSQFVHQPGQPHMDAALHLVRYLKGCPDQGLFFPVSNSPTLTAFCDADWAVARSTAEAKYRSLGTTVCELKWISYLLQDLHLNPPTPIPLYCDNQAAIHIVANSVFHERTKHIEIDCHLVWDHYKSGFVLPSYVASKSQLADIFTKSLRASAFRSLLSKLALVSPSQVQLEGGLMRLQNSSSNSYASDFSCQHVFTSTRTRVT